jgi:hypothetical protein
VKGPAGPLGVGGGGGILRVLLPGGRELRAGKGQCAHETALVAVSSKAAVSSAAAELGT